QATPRIPRSHPYLKFLLTLFKIVINILPIFSKNTIRFLKVGLRIQGFADLDLKISACPGDYYKQRKKIHRCYARVAKPEMAV
ncbi:hypothetical protein, partial [Limnofasciculus baicalensis]